MFIDRDEKQLNFKVAVRGAPVVGWLRTLASVIGAPDDPESEPGGGLFMLPLALGAVRGWKVEFHFHATTSALPGPRLLTLKSADAVVELFEGIDASTRAKRIAELNEALEDFGYEPATFPRFASFAEAVDGFDHTDPAEGPMALVKKVSRRLILEAKEHLV